MSSIVKVFFAASRDPNIVEDDSFLNLSEGLGLTVVRFVRSELCKISLHCVDFSETSRRMYGNEITSRKSSSQQITIQSFSLS